MSHRKAVSHWEQQVSMHLGSLSRPQAHVLALWSYGMVLAKSCGITSVVALLADVLGASAPTLRQQLREWYYDAQDKKGKQRQEVDVTLCFGPLLGWIVSWWPASECRLALGMDATTLTDRFTVLCISVLYRGCAIPVAWKVLREGEKGAWEPYWKALFTALQGQVRQSMDSDRAGRSRAVCALALPPHQRCGLASVPAYQSGRQGASARNRAL